MIDEAAVWIDIRHRDQFAKGAFRNARNIPNAVIRVEHRKLVKGRKYIVCGEDPGSSAAAAFLLAERGYDVSYIEEPLSKLLASEEAAVRPAEVISGEADTETVVPFPPIANEIRGKVATEESNESDAESPIIEMDDGYGSSLPVPRDAYADTVTGAHLADLVEEISGQFQELQGAGSQEEGDAVDEETLDTEDLVEQEPASPPSEELDGSVPALAQEVPDIRDFELSIPDEQMSQITREMLFKIRRCVGAFASAQRLRYEEQLRARTAQVEAVATKELHRKAEEIRLIYQGKADAKQRALRRHYQRLLRLANQVTQQKAELQQARNDLEKKLRTTDSLYREVHDIRRMLTQRIGNLDGLDAGNDNNNTSAS